MPDLHTERPTRMAGGKTYCACGVPWPCEHARAAKRLETARRALAHWREYRGNPDHTVTLPAGVLHDLVVSTEALVDLLAGGETRSDGEDGRV